MWAPGHPVMNARRAPRRAPALDGAPRIFVRMAAYRDPECAWTVADAFDKADHPDRVFFGICWQYQPGVDETVPAFDRPAQVRFTRVAAGISRGVCWARHQAELLWRGEELTMQVDSHSRFSPGWDTRLVDELARCPSDKPILSTSPASYAPPATLEPNPTPLVRCARPFGQEGELRFEAHPREGAPGAPMRNAFIAGGFLFSRGEVLREVPYDPHLYFSQEEAAYTLRLFTHGWDVFAPSIVAVYHYYNPGGSAEKSVRPLHWHDNTAWVNMHHRARLRFDHLTGHRRSEDPEVITELARFGLGAARSLARFEVFAGVDFRNKRVSERGLRGEVDATVLDASVPVEGETAGGGEDHAAAPFLEARAAASGGGAGADGAAAGRAASGAGVVIESDAGAGPGLRVGAFVPYFSLLDETGQLRRIHDHGGAPTALTVLPAEEPAFYRRFFTALAREVRAASGLQRVIVLPLPPSRLRGIKRRYGIDVPLWSDAELRVSGLVAAGSGRPQRAAAVSCLLGPNLQIARIYRDRDLARQLEELARDAKALARPPRRAPAAAHAPVLLIPGVLARAECARAIERFEAGPQWAGTVGGGARMRYDARNKIRTDGELPAALVIELDRIFAQTMFPEVRKIFGFDVTHREPWKIGRYDAAKGGFFYRHRDNADEELAYRRCAVSVNLNDDYDGGEIQFPEYGGALYRPEAGSALVFPCALMHQVAKMKAGARYALISFLFGADDARRWTERNGRDLDGMAVRRA
jgi:predicted 2-oxoglutarate/Fe(II)-dependent dioxygenase YbiX